VGGWPPPTDVERPGVGSRHTPSSLPGEAAPGPFAETFRVAAALTYNSRLLPVKVLYVYN